MAHPLPAHLLPLSPPGSSWSPPGLRRRPNEYIPSCSPQIGSVLWKLVLPCSRLAMTAGSLPMGEKCWPPINPLHLLPPPWPTNGSPPPTACPRSSTQLASYRSSLIALLPRIPTPHLPIALAQRRSDSGLPITAPPPHRGRMGRTRPRNGQDPRPENASKVKKRSQTIN